MQLDSERYSRQIAIEGWDQEKIQKTRVAIVGEGNLADYMTIDALCCGFGGIKRLGKGNNRFAFDEFNPQVDFEEEEGKLVNGLQAKIFLDDCDIIIDATNDFNSKKLSASAALASKKLYFSASAMPNRFSWTNKTDPSFLREHHNELGNDQSKNNSILCSACVIEEVRKQVMPLASDELMPQNIQTGIEELVSLNKRILQVGAGAIGTFTGLALCELGCKVDIADFDYVEEHNLNRQFLFYDSIGKNKAEALVEKLSGNESHFRARNEKIDARVDLKNYDLVLSCVDNALARIDLMHAARKYNKPIINGGSSKFAGAAMIYSEKYTACLDCQQGYALSEAIKENNNFRKRNGECFFPSLVMANQIVSGLMMHVLALSNNEEYKRIDYQSGYPLFSRDISKQCYDACTFKH